MALIAPLWISLECLFDAGDDWHWVNDNEILGSKLWMLKCFLHRPGLMWNRFSATAWPLFSLSLLYVCLSCSDAQCLLPLYFCLSSSSSPSLPGTLSVSLHTRDLLSSRCIYSPVAPCRPRASPWLAGWCLLLLLLFTFPSGNGSVTAKKIQTPTYGQIIHPCTNRQAGTHKLHEKCNAFKGFSVSLFSFYHTPAAFQSINSKMSITGPQLIIHFDDFGINNAQ